MGTGCPTWAGSECVLRGSIALVGHTLHTSFVGVILGTVFILAAITVSSSTILASLGTGPAETRAQLLLGATLLRFAFAALGIATIVLGKMPIWQSRQASERSASRTDHGDHR